MALGVMTPRAGGDWLGRKRSWRLTVVKRIKNSCTQCGSDDVECTGKWRDPHRPDAYYRCRACDARWRVRWVAPDA